MIDFYYMYCLDLKVLVEEFVGVLLEFVLFGKICFVGLLEMFVDMLCKVYVVYLIIVM